jgi:threonine synthase
VFAEPAGAVPLAGLLKSNIDANKSVCLVVTGNGLKDTSNVKVKDVKTYSVDEVVAYFGKEQE